MVSYIMGQPVSLEQFDERLRNMVKTQKSFFMPVTFAQ